MPKFIDLTDAVFGRLTVVRRGPNHERGHVRWYCRCECGVETLVWGTHLRSGNTTSCGCAQRAAAAVSGRANKRAAVGYSAAHYRVRAARGGAEVHTCVDCTEQAAEWSYDRTDPNELYQERSGFYSLKPEHYSPRCVPCHKAFDREAADA